MKFLKIRTLAFGFVVKLLSKLFFVDMPPLVSVMAFIKKNEKYLFLNLTYLNGYGVPGGLIKEDESIDEAIKREILEETGLKVITQTYLGSVPSSFRHLSTLSLVFDVEAEGELKSSREGKLIWMDLIEARKNLAYESAQMAVDKFKLK